jgi:hypothetical protein
MIKAHPIILISALMIYSLSIAQDPSDETVPETLKKTNWSDFGDNAQQVDAQNQNSLAKQEKSDYILQGSAPARNPSSTVDWDFTTGSDKYHGGASGAKDLGDGNWGMIAGDANESGGVSATDYLSVKPISGEIGYYNADCNLNTNVNATDYLQIKPNSGKNTSLP